MSHRIPQVNELIKQQVNNLLLTEVEFSPNCLVTIVKVETTKDLRQTKVWLSVLPVHYAGKVLNKLAHQAGHLQFMLNKRLTTKPLPRLSFAFDDTEQKAADIEQLLDRIKE